jgi:hypothetical protein
MLKDKIKKNPIQVSPPNLKIKVMRKKKKKLIGVKSQSGKLYAPPKREDLLRSFQKHQRTSFFAIVIRCMQLSIFLYVIFIKILN